jgi:Uma2 family endonuclease
MSIQPAFSDAQFPATLLPLSAGMLPVRRFTVDEYHRMIETGILGENDRVELVDGWIVHMSPIGPPHMTCVHLVMNALQDKLPDGWIVRSQGPITLATSEPEPDVTVVRGKVRDYRDRHPGGDVVALVVEVADTSLQFDRLQKGSQYAAAGIPEYWIVNLIDRAVEVYRGPAGGRYPAPKIVSADARLELILAGNHVGSLAVPDLLP